MNLDELIRDVDPVRKIEPVDVESHEARSLYRQIVEGGGRLESSSDESTGSFTSDASGPSRAVAQIQRPRASRKWVVVGLMVVLTSTGGYLAYEMNKGPTRAVPTLGIKGLSGADSSAADSALVLPPQLPESDGFNPSSGAAASTGGSSNSTSSTSWTEVSSSSAPLWPGVVSGDSQAPFGATDLGLTGGLSQVWVVSSSVAKYGNLNTGLQLPIPLSFAEAKPGPVEIDVTVLQFSNLQAPMSLFNSNDYSHLAPPWTGVNQIAGSVPNGGRVAQIDSQANGGLIEYQFQWSDGYNWVQVSVLGARMSQSQAEAIAAQVAA
jgi:hypothetical protein